MEVIRRWGNIPSFFICNQLKTEDSDNYVSVKIYKKVNVIITMNICNYGNEGMIYLLYVKNHAYVKN